MKGLRLAEPASASPCFVSARIPTISRSAPASPCCSWQAAGVDSMFTGACCRRADAREEEARASAADFLRALRARQHRDPSLPRRLFPGQASDIKVWFEGLRARPAGCHPHPPRRRRASGPSRGQPAHLEHVPRPPDPRIRDPQVGRRPRPAQPLRARRGSCDGAQSRVALTHFGTPALQALVRRGDVPRPGAPARHGVPRRERYAEAFYARKMRLGYPS